MDETRKAFEAWVQDLGWNAARLKPDGILNGVYKNATTQGLWRAWQAACAVEREACAAICESERDEAQTVTGAFRAQECAKRIRARSKQ